MTHESDLFHGTLPSILVPANETLLLREITPEELGLRFVRDGQFDVVVSDSRKYAKVFHKRHDNVVRDIDEIQKKMSSNLRACFFHEAQYIDQYDRPKRCIDLTKRGALVLGARYDPMILVAVVLAFEKMANALAERSTLYVQPILDAIDAVVRDSDSRQENWKNHVVGLVSELGQSLREHIDFIEGYFVRQRVELSPEDERTVIAVTKMFFMGACPCCQKRRLLNEQGEPLIKSDGNRILILDHMRQSSVAGLLHVWPVCSGEKGDKENCNYKLTYGRNSPAFRVKQEPSFQNWVRRIVEYLEHVDTQEKLPFTAKRSTSEE